MNYDNMKKNAAICNDPCAIPDEVTLAQTLSRAIDMAREILQMSYAINDHLFGKGPVKGEEKEPKCFRDALLLHSEIIECAANELRSICRSLGV